MSKRVATRRKKTETQHYKQSTSFWKKGIIFTHKQIGFKSKLDEKNSVGIFVGYATEHGGDIYRM